MKASIFIVLTLLSVQISFGQNDLIERSYFPNARAKNAAIAAARYAEEGYFYTKYTTYISAIDSSRMFADTALFFIKRSLMLGDTALAYAPIANKDARDYLYSGKLKAGAADTIIREFYPMVEIGSHNIFGTDAALHLSTAVMDFFNASLLLRSEYNAPETEKNRYEVLPFDDEIIRLEVDETAFQQAANEYEVEIAMLADMAVKIEENIVVAPDQKSRHKLRNRLDEVNNQLGQAIDRLQDTSHRIEEIRQLLSQKHLEDVQDVEEPDHLSKFETTSADVEVRMDEMVPDGLVYKIQLGYYPSDVDIDNFHGLFPISGETVRKDLARYYAGLFFSLQAAMEGNKYVRENAIANAFVVPFYNGEKISISWAVEIEKARGIK